MADTASFDFNPDLRATRLWDIPFDELEITVSFADLDSFHSGHKSSLSNSSD
jgi:hypothetical protein